MPRPPKTFTIPFFEDLKCIATLKKEGYTQRQMADYYGIAIGAFARYVKEYNTLRRTLGIGTLEEPDVWGDAQGKRF